MTRKKVKLCWIANDSARRASLKKRKAGLTKKTSELHTLCAVSTFIIIFGPEDIEPAIWPPGPAIQEIIMHYQSLSNMEQTKKNLNQEGFLNQRLKKVLDQGKKVCFKWKQAQTSYLMHQMDRGKSDDDFTYSDMQNLIWLMEMRLKDYRGRDYFLAQIAHPELALLPASGVNTSHPYPLHLFTTVEIPQLLGDNQAPITEQAHTGLDQGARGSYMNIIRSESMVVPNHYFVGGGFMGGNELSSQNMTQFQDPFSFGANKFPSFMHETSWPPSNMNDPAHGNWTGFEAVDEMGLLPPDSNSSCKVSGQAASMETSRGSGVGLGGQIEMQFGFLSGGNDGGFTPASTGGEMVFPDDGNKTWPNNQYFP